MLNVALNLGFVLAVCINIIPTAQKFSIAEALLAHRMYDTDELIEMIVNAATKTVIPPKENRKTQREHENYIYKLRYVI